MVDCFDGTDEPGTSACSALEPSVQHGGRFWCPNHVTGSGKYLASSRVQDRVCDCCNGADETAMVSTAHLPRYKLHNNLTMWQSDIFKPCANGWICFRSQACPDTCSEAASAWRNEMQRRLAGFEQRKEYIRNGKLFVSGKAGEWSTRRIYLSPSQVNVEA